MSVLHSLCRKALPVLGAAIFFIDGCDSTGEPIVPVPADMQMVRHAFADDTLAVERGIDAVPDEIDGIYLAWYAVNDRNIKQYNIYRRRDDETYFRQIRTIPTATVGIDTIFIDNNAGSGLLLNTYYHYFVRASNTQDVEGKALDTLKYMLLPKPVLRLPDGGSFSPDSLPTLAWDFVDIPNEYILRIENMFGQLIYIGILQSSYDNNSQTKDLNEIVDFPGLTSGTYTWRIDSIGPDEDNSGSEAVPKTFDIF